MTLQELISHFEVARRISNTSYQCKCPAHEDKTASLTISEKSGKLLLRCHAGCKTENVLAAVGLTFKEISDHRQDTSTWKKRLEYSQKKKIEAIYDYRAEDGKYLYSKVRFEGKEIRYVTIDESTDSYQYCKARIATLYRLPELISSIKNGYPVYIVEGEKDVETLRKLGYTATTAGSVNDWRSNYAKYFTGAKVIILPDNDVPGLQLKDQIIKDLRHYAHSIRWTITSQAAKGDVTDYLTEGNTKEDLKQLVSEIEDTYAPWVYTVGKGDNKTLKVNGDQLADSISKGLSYLIVRRPDEEKDDFYLYEHGVYSKCNRNRVKSVIMRYLPTGLATDNLLNNVYNLLLCKENNLCSFRDMDTDENYINLKNGLYNIRTKQLEPHTPNLHSTIQLACEYHPEAKNKPVFEHYMEDLCTNEDGLVDVSKMAVLQEFMGLILSNVSVYRVKTCLVLWSLLGNSGKTQLLNLIGELLGEDKIANVPIQHMNEESKFALGSIVGKRLISIGDQTSSEIKDSSVFKQLTGGDQVKVEPKNRQPFYYRYTGGIAIACNNLPTFTDDKGGHLFERLCIVPCTNTIEPEKRDPELLNKMLKEKDAILNWFLEGLHRLIGNQYKLTRSAACEEAARDYREKLDTVYRYLSECYIITGKREDMVSKLSFDNSYTLWCQANGYTPVNKQNIRDRMAANGCQVSKGNWGDKRGVMVYRHLIEKDSGDFRSAPKEEYEQLKIPFDHQ